MIRTIREAWGWRGIDPAELIKVNRFANIILKDTKGVYWRICPEEVYCEIIANTEEEYEAMLKDPNFLEDWEMQTMCKEAMQYFGSLPEDRCYCLKIPGILGGEYSGENMSTVTIKEAISFSGHLGQKLIDLPDGSKVKLDLIP